MSLNCVEIDKILEEISLSGCHIQKIKQPDFHSLFLELYRPGGRFNLIIGLAPGKTRIHTTANSAVSEIKLQRFAQLMRARIKGGKITGIQQINQDRIIKIEISRSGETTVLWVRLWSGAANIIATDSEQKILDAFYRRPKRGETSGSVFTLPENKGNSSGKVFEIRDYDSSQSFNNFIDEYYSHVEENENIDRLRDRAVKIITAAINRIESTLKNLERKASEYGPYEEYKETGDLIMSNLHLAQKGAKWLKVENFYKDNTETDIELDPRLTAEKNAEKYYTMYRKAKSGIDIVNEDIENHRLQLKNLRGDLLIAETTEDSSLLKKISESSPKQQQKTKEKESTPGLSFRSGMYRILVGRSATENDQLLRKHVRGNDIWLHTRDYPGGYVFIKTLPGKSVPLDILLDAGNLALFYSKARNSGKAELYYTQVKYLRRAKDGKTGLVLPTQEKNLSVILDQRRIDRIMNPEN